MLKYINYLINFILTILVIIVLLLTLLNFSSAPEKKGLFGYKGYTVLSDSMVPTFSAGDYIVDKLTPFESLKEGQIISYNYKEDILVTHRITSITPEGIHVKGDQNKQEDDTLITKSNYIGQYQFRIPMLGTLAQKVNQPLVVISIILAIAILLLFLYFRK